MGECARTNDRAVVLCAARLLLERPDCHLVVDFPFEQLDTSPREGGFRKMKC